MMSGMNRCFASSRSLETKLQSGDRTAPTLEDGWLNERRHMNRKSPAEEGLFWDNNETSGILPNYSLFVPVSELPVSQSPMV